MLPSLFWMFSRGLGQTLNQNNTLRIVLCTPLPDTTYSQNWQDSFLVAHGDGNSNTSQHILLPSPFLSVSLFSVPNSNHRALCLKMKWALRQRLAQWLETIYVSQDGLQSSMNVTLTFIYYDMNQCLTKCPAFYSGNSKNPEL